jgi:hypothetical protein
MHFAKMDMVAPKGLAFLLYGERWLKGHYDWAPKKPFAP